MFDLKDLYREVILDHNRSPRNFGKLDPCDHKAEGRNPLCGDRYEVFVTMQEGRIQEIGFVGEGCAISKASASVMTDLLKGKTPEEVAAFFKSFQALVTGENKKPDLEELGKLAVFAGVSAFPVRVKCAILPWYTIQAALKGEGEPVTTE